MNQAEEEKKKFDKQLENYAELLIKHGLNVQKGQRVEIQGEIIHRDLLYRAAKHAWRAGASYVGVDFIDPYLTHLRLMERPDKESVSYIPAFIPKKFSDMVDENVAFLRIIGSEEPHLLAEFDASIVHNLRSSYKRSIKKFYEEGIGKSKMHWTLAAASTPAWAKEIFTNLPTEEAYQRLWQQIFTVCRVDSDDFLQRWKTHNEALHQRAQRLTEMKIKYLHFTGGGTDLKVGLSPKARFTGGGTKGPFGQAEYEANIPTEECFTTPDWRMTEGHAVVTRPLVVNDVLIDGLELTFKQGELVDFKARNGSSMFEHLKGVDEGAKRLGEVALVGIDSPIYQSGLLFREILFDENAACHVAIGSAYRFCLEGGETMGEAEAESLGCNSSNTHCDMMISSEEVDVVAITYDNEQITLLRHGSWVI